MDNVIQINDVVYLSEDVNEESLNELSNGKGDEDNE